MKVFLIIYLYSGISVSEMPSGKICHMVGQRIMSEKVKNDLWNEKYECVNGRGAVLHE